MTMRDEILRVLREYLSADVSVDEWDEPPSLSLILRGPDEAVIFEPMPVGEDIWNMGPVHRVLEVVATVTRETTGRGWQWLSEDESLLGVALFSEGWGVSTTVQAGELSKIEKYMAAGGRLADHPAGVECKMISAALTDGSSLHLTYFRDGEFVDTNDKGGGEVAGRVPDGLNAILAAFSGGRS